MMGKESTKETTAKLKRYVLLSDDVDQDSARQIMQDLFKLEAEDPTSDIVMIINSSGGYVNCMWGIIDSMNLLRCAVHTLCVGNALSAAALILMSGNDGKRYATPNSRIMIHQISAGFHGTTKNLETQAREILRLEEMSKDLVIKETKITKQLLEKMISNDWYLSAFEAQKLGVIDKVITNFGEVKAKGASW